MPSISRIMAIAAVLAVFGCTTTQHAPQRFVWVRVDGKIAAKDPAMLAELRAFVAQCRADAAKATGLIPTKVTGIDMQPCMLEHGYRLETLPPGAGYTRL